MKFCFELINQVFLNFYIITIILNIYLFKSIKCTNIIPNNIKQIIKQNYFQLNLLSSGKTLILNNDIICSYNSEFSNRIINNKKNIICLENYQYIYIINNADTYLYKFDVGNLRENNGNFFNLIPYSFNNNIFFIISYINDNNNALNMIQYQIKKNEKKCKKINEKVFIKKEISSFQYPLNCTVSTNEKKNINLFLCLFLDQQNIYSFEFDIQREFNINRINNIICQDCLEEGHYSYYSDIAINQGNNIIFLCYKININMNNENNSYCFFYYIRYNIFREIQHIFLCDKFLKNYYFSETKEYSIICQNEGNTINIYTINLDNIDNNNFLISTINTRDFNCQTADNFFLYLNSSKKEYNLINDCDNNHNFVYLLNISYSNNTSYIKNSRRTNDIVPLSRNDYFDKFNFTNFSEVKIDDKIYFVKGLDYTMIFKNILTNYSQQFQFTSIDISDCVSLLSSEFNPNTTIISILQIERDNPNSDSLTNIVEYKLYDENYTELNLTKCKDLKTVIKYHLKKNMPVDLNTVSYFSNFNINIFDSSHPFFNEFCRFYPDFEKDIIMEDRITDVYQPFTICEQGCTYINTHVEDIKNENVFFECECDIKNSINNKIPPSIKQNENIEQLKKSTNNFQILKCFSLVFSSDDKINNLGFWIFTFVLGAHVPLWLHYINSGIKPIHNFILDVMTEYGYLANNKKNNTKKVTMGKKGKTGKTGKKGKNIKKDSSKDKIIDKGINANNNHNNDINYKNTSMPPPKNKNLDKKNEKKDEKNDKNTKKKKKSKTSRLSKNNLINKNGEKQLGIIGIEAKNKNSKKTLNKHTQNNYNTIIFTSNEVINKKTGKKKKKLNKKDIDADNIKSDKSANLMNSHSQYYYDDNDIDDEDYKMEKIGINLININVNDVKNRDIKPKESNKILNNYTYEEAIKYDKRSYCIIFYIFLLSKQIIFHLFAYKSPLELMSIRAFVVLFIYSSHLAFNALFYFNTHVSKYYHSNEGLVEFTFNNNMGIIFLSSFLSFGFTVITTKLSNPTLCIREIFQEEEKKLKSDKKYTVTKKRKDEIMKKVEKILGVIKIKFLGLFIGEIIIMLFFWYYLTAFGHIYSNTQYNWILNCAISIVINFILEFMFCLIFAMLYKISISHKINCLYKFIMFLYNYI